MEQFDPKKQSGDLTGAIDKAKEKRPKKRSKKKIALIGVGLIALGGLAFNSCRPVPPHEERVAYIRNNLSPLDEILRFTRPYFHGSMTAIQMPDWILGNALVRFGLFPQRHLKLIGFDDKISSDDGVIDDTAIFVIYEDGEGMECELDYDELPKSLQKRFDIHYERVTRNTYRSLNGALLSKVAFWSGLGRREWKAYEQACRESGQAIDFTGLDQLPEKYAEMGLLELLDNYLEAGEND